MSAACQSSPILASELTVFDSLRSPCLSQGCRHPLGFYTVCLAVFFERWAACMMGASVVLMLCEKYGCARGNALRMAGLYNAASYLAALPGGFAVDHMLGPRRSLGAGAALLALGYAVLTLSGYTALCVAVGLLLIGHALFKQR